MGFCPQELPATHLCAQRGPEMSTQVQVVRKSVIIFNLSSRKDEENNIMQGDA